MNCPRRVAQRGQADRLAGGIDLAQFGLAQAVLVTVLGQHPARLALGLLCAQRGGGAELEDHHDQHDDRHQVDHLAEAANVPAR